ncbi:hypothetical protein E2C01_031351 [Portunus trituberculatus]|uniref:Uncharacterized protein n=1 Tax=Portunus trituberculatus TaxID=210409 RepID=A0A5B7EXF8_PORTR|nr:hypothetical protein [Portunus trituberculatus]
MFRRVGAVWRGIGGNVVEQLSGLLLSVQGLHQIQHVVIKHEVQQVERPCGEVVTSRAFSALQGN